MTKKTLSWFSAMLLAGAIVGCGSSSKKETTPAVAPQPGEMSPGDAGVPPTSMAPTGNPCGTGAAASGNPCSK